MKITIGQIKDITIEEQMAHISENGDWCIADAETLEPLIILKGEMNNEKFAEFILQRLTSSPNESLTRFLMEGI